MCCSLTELPAQETQAHERSPRKGSHESVNPVKVARAIEAVEVCRYSEQGVGASASIRWDDVARSMKMFLTGPGGAPCDTVNLSVGCTSFAC